MPCSPADARPPLARRAGRHDTKCHHAISRLDAMQFDPSEAVVHACNATILGFAQVEVGEWQLREHAFKRAAMLERCQ